MERGYINVMLQQTVLCFSDLDMPFARWDTDRVALWLHVMGLSMYVGECKRWIKNGAQLLEATSHDLEKASLSELTYSTTYLQNR